MNEDIIPILWIVVNPAQSLGTDSTRQDELFMLIFAEFRNHIGIEENHRSSPV